MRFVAGQSGFGVSGYGYNQSMPRRWGGSDAPSAVAESESCLYWRSLSLAASFALEVASERNMDIAESRTMGALRARRHQRELLTTSWSIRHWQDPRWIAGLFILAESPQ